MIGGMTGTTAAPAPAMPQPDSAGLTTGWEPELAESDTLARRYVFHWARLCELVADAAGGTTVRNAAFVSSDTGRPGGYFNSVTLLQPPDPATADELATAVTNSLRSGAGEVHLWSLWPIDLRDHGWRLDGHPPLMVRGPGAPPRVVVEPDRVELHRVELRRVEDEARLADWVRTATEAYPLPGVDPDDPMALAPARLLDRDELRLYVGYDDGRPVSISSAFVEDGIASCVLDATLPSHRGRGHGARHHRRRIADAPETWWTGVFSDPGRPPAERAGYAAITRFTTWTLDRP